ncbi:DUF2163 domain-containing protein [Celeribacter marinus]|uniref:FAD/FMN-containing dehydrogenase n=1 Tax=Celeribacter marinus TaxID=1397108 RepID=A0A0P0A060_9RHOB|nr:DUF2163 domain-containing protein [Celeribacter marinus]ALI56055.1 FAD/FMN-containing dehydrogenase [Celeribacter marinus]SFK94821.1 phage conserved hypothetical protein BR0599 [Celeribacter marinus]
MAVPSDHFPAALKAHLARGITTVCRAWALTRRDGVVLGFTDHDLDLRFDGIVFKADTGLTAQALEQTTGLSVDNTESLGALSSVAVDERDIEAGRFDSATVKAWLVNWADVSERVLQFNGTFGEITRVGGGFRAELRGLTEGLNQPQGRVYHSACSAVLGGASCGFDLDALGYSAEVSVEAVDGARVFRMTGLAEFDDRWFERGRLVVRSGAAAGLVGIVKNDRLTATGRVIDLWDPLRGAVAVGDTIRLEAGCDKRAETCRLKFNNFNNFRGFPHIPGDDWLAAYPSSSDDNDGGSRQGGA